MAKVTLGLKVRTGKAAVVALRGPAAEPEVVGKALIQVAFTFEEGAVFHAVEELPTAKARAHVERAEARFTKLALKELTAFLATLGVDVAAARLAAPVAKPLPLLEKIVKSHPLVHAAEIELYRRVFTAACEALHVPPKRVDEGAKRVASALGWTSARVAQHLASMGKAAGRPWAAEQKEAALAAWLALAQR
jgi:hypothetical protein